LIFLGKSMSRLERAKVDKFVSMASLTEFLSSSGACKCSVQMLWILLELSAQSPRHFGSTGCKSSGGLQRGCARGCAGVVRWLCGHFQGYCPFGLIICTHMELVRDRILWKPWTSLGNSIKSLREEMAPFPCHACWVVS